MKNSIIDKLKALLAGEIDTECKVVYLLAESRKLLETYRPDPAPVALKIYCHWALHIDLEYPNVTLPFLKQVDDFAASVLGKSDFVQESKMFREFVFLETFRDQLKHFFKAYSLPTGMCDEDQRWYDFLKYYAGVIEDGSLSCRAKSESLKLIREVTFTKGRPTADTFIPFSFSWIIALRDGRKLTVDVGASAPNGKEMIFHGGRLHLS
jgi:hypothetical protein